MEQCLEVLFLEHLLVDLLVEQLLDLLEDYFQDLINLRIGYLDLKLMMAMVENRELEDSFQKVLKIF